MVDSQYLQDTMQCILKVSW